MISRRLRLLAVDIMVTGAFVSAAKFHAFGHEPASEPRAMEAVRREVDIPVPDFSLTDQTGRLFKFESLRGKLVLLTFMYTTCPDICPLITTSMRSVQKNLRGSQHNSVFLLSITTDPEIDSPQILKSYAGRYQVDFSNWSFLTGNLKELAPIWKAFGVKVQKKARGLVDHTTLMALVDENGVMRFAYYGASPDHRVVLRDMRSLLLPP